MTQTYPGMRFQFDSNAAKRPANLSINSDLLQQAKSIGINLSATLEEALAVELARRRRAQWLAENQSAVAAYNERVENVGVFSDGLRSF